MDDASGAEVHRTGDWTPAVNLSGFVELVRRRGWVVAAAVALGLGAAGLYAWQQRAVYEATATLYVHPSQAFLSHAGPGTVSSELGVLTYGPLVNTVLSVAQSRSTLSSAAAPLRIPSGRLGHYSVVATARPKSFVLDVSVDGPSRQLAVSLANALSRELRRSVSTQFPVVSLSTLDAASTATQIRPRLGRDLVYGALAGLIIGLVLACVAVSPARRVDREGYDSALDGPRPDEPPAEEPQSAPEPQALHPV